MKLCELIGPEEIASCTSTYYPGEERLAKAGELCVVRGETLIFKGVNYRVTKTGTYQTTEVEVERI